MFFYKYAIVYRPQNRQIAVWLALQFLTGETTWKPSKFGIFGGWTAKLATLSIRSRAAQSSPLPHGGVRDTHGIYVNFLDFPPFPEIAKSELGSGRDNKLVFYLALYENASSMLVLDDLALPQNRA